ncbi:hypothetical protein CI610_01016 [invertebrate metagenome]|uniref:Uncharacterized protein n=1 Tax=invertebrate metagenome TaxID=1711999 RepID=A0A2H9T9T1_9ZZZZ
MALCNWLIDKVGVIEYHEGYVLVIAVLFKC